MSCDNTGVVSEKDFWSCVVEGPGIASTTTFDFDPIYTGMRILRCSDGVNTMVCDEESIVVGLLNKTIEVYDRASLNKVII